MGPSEETRPGTDPDSAVDRILAALPDAVLVLDAGGGIGRANRGAEILLGAGRGELLGQDIRVMDPGGLGGWLGSNPAARPAAAVTVPGPAPGSSIEWRVRPFADGLLALGRNVSALAGTQDFVREAENAINRRIFETSLDLILVVGRTGDFIRVSPSAQRILGRSPEEMTGRNGVDFVYPPDLDNTREEMRQGRLGRLMRNFDCRYVHRDGSIVPLAWAGVWSEPEQQHFFIGRDMSDRNAAEERLRRAQRLEAVGQLTGGLAHDFNNLLSVVVGNLELLRERPDAGPMLELIDAALDASFRGAELTRQLLAFARRQSLDTQAFDMNERVIQTLGLLRRTLGERIEVSTILARDLRPAYADAAQLESALVNLTINARDAMPDGGRLVIETANQRLDGAYAGENIDVVPGSYVMLAVTDTGTGMAPEVVARVFEPFFTTKATGRGSGLGLSMVYGYARQSHGHVKIYSEPGRGSTVRLYLPVADTKADGSAVPEPADDRIAGAGERVLLVEDDARVRAVALAQLRRLGYEVLEADNADAALAILRGDQPVDLLFTDVVMPGSVTGDALARVARELRPGIRVLLTSGFATGAAQSGPRAEDYRNLLSKPYRMVDLAAKLREILEAPPSA